MLGFKQFLIKPWVSTSFFFFFYKCNGQNSGNLIRSSLKLLSTNQLNANFTFTLLFPDEKVYVMEEEKALSLESLETFVRTFHDNVNQLKVLKQSKVLAKKEQSSAAIQEVNAGNFAETIAQATENKPGKFLIASIG